jgi:hypothetical protein
MCFIIFSPVEFRVQTRISKIGVRALWTRGERFQISADDAARLIESGQAQVIEAQRFTEARLPAPRVVLLEARLAHGFPLDMQQVEVREMLKMTDNSGHPFPPTK